MKLSESFAKLEEKLPFGKMLSPVIGDIENDATKFRDQIGNPMKGGGPPDFPSPSAPKFPELPNFKDKLPEKPALPELPKFGNKNNK